MVQWLNHPRRGGREEVCPMSPLPFLNCQNTFKEKIKEKVAHLIAVGLWECVTNLKSNGHGLLTY